MSAGRSSNASAIDSSSMRVVRFGILRERLAELLGAAEPAAQRKVLPQRIAFLVLLPHQDAAQVGMADERDAEHVVALALQPVGALVDVPHARHFERRALRRVSTLTRRKRRIRERAQMPDDFERLLEVAELDRGDVGEIVVAAATDRRAASE